VRAAPPLLLLNLARPELHRRDFFPPRSPCLVSNLAGRSRTNRTRPPPLLVLIGHLPHRQVTQSEALSAEKRLAFVTESRHALGKTALLLSGGAALGMYHLGVVKCLPHLPHPFSY